MSQTPPFVRSIIVRAETDRMLRDLAKRKRAEFWDRMIHLSEDHPDEEWDRLSNMLARWDAVYTRYVGRTRRKPAHRRVVPLIEN